MKKRLTNVAVVLLMVCMCILNIVMPISANSDINSRGDLILEDSDVAFYSGDVEKLNNQVDKLSENMSEASYAAEQVTEYRDDIKSKGIIDYDSQKVVFDSSDLIMLANRIDTLNNDYKYMIVSALNNINTYFKEDGTIVHSNEAGVISPEAASKLNANNICDGIEQSQSVAHLAADNIVPASNDNLSEGSAAWVDGKLLIGTGKDNQDKYQEGYDKGYEEGKAADSGVVCYCLGTTNRVSNNGQKYYDIKLDYPDVDYTKLTRDNFIFVPIRVESSTEKSTNNASISGSVTPYCTIPEKELTVSKFYDSETGRLFLGMLELTATGGLSSKSGYVKTTASYVECYVYMVVGEIAGI